MLLEVEIYVLKKRNIDNKVQNSYQGMLKKLQTERIWLPNWKTFGTPATELSKEIQYNIECALAGRQDAEMCLLLDTLPHSDTEFCDILRVVGGTTYLFQVKRKLDSSSLAHAFNQIGAAVRTLQLARNNDSFMEKLFNGLRPELGNCQRGLEKMRASVEFYQKSTFSYDSFSNALKQKVVYVFAYADLEDNLEETNKKYVPHLCYDLFHNSKKWGATISLAFHRIELENCSTTPAEELRKLQQEVDDFMQKNSDALA